MAKKKIKIDPGHSKNTPGKAVHPYYEYSSNRRKAVILKAMLEASGFEVSYTVNLNDAWDKPLYSRALDAVKWKADLLVSLHDNAHNDQNVRGTETFVHSSSTASVPIAQAVQSALVKSLGTSNRGVKKANFGILRDSYKHMLSILVEGEFFSNPIARKWMLTNDYDSRYAEGVARGICAFYGVAYKGTVKAAITPKPAATAPIKNPATADMVSVKVNGLYTYKSKNWDDKGPKVDAGETFTIAATHTVAGHKMYELVSGLFITASPTYVTFMKGALITVQPTPAAPSKPAPTVAAPAPKPAEKPAASPTKGGTKMEFKEWQRKEFALIFKKAEEKGIFDSDAHEKAVLDGTMSDSMIVYLVAVVAGTTMNDGKRLR